MHVLATITRYILPFKVDVVSSPMYAHFHNSGLYFQQHTGRNSRVELRDHLYSSLHFDRVVLQPHNHQSTHSCNPWHSRKIQDHRKSGTLCVYVRMCVCVCVCVCVCTRVLYALYACVHMHAHNSYI